MAATISFGGLISGLDTKSIVTSLVSIRRRKETDPINALLTLNNNRNTAMQAVKTTLDDLYASAQSILETVPNAFSAQKSTSSDTSVVLINATNSTTAVAGTYTISGITQLAQPDRIVFDGVANSNTALFGTGNITLSVGSGAAKTIAITSSNNTLEQMMTAINDAGAGVTASIINDGGANPYRLVLTANSTGSENIISQDLSTVLSGLTVDPVSADPENEPKSAIFKLNSTDMTSSTNTITSAIPGVSFTLIDTEEVNTITISVGSDTTAVSAKIKSFVAAYNTANTTLAAIFKRDAKGKATNPLASDYTLQAAQEFLNNTMLSQYTKFYTSGYQSLSSIGISLNAKNQLTVDDSKLGDALKNNINGVKTLFQGTSAAANDGIAKKMETYLKTLIATNVGELPRRLNGYQVSTLNLAEELISRENRILDYQKKLETKFTKMEQMLAKLKTQSDYWSSYTGVSTSSK